MLINFEHLTVSVQFTFDIYYTIKVCECLVDFSVSKIGIRGQRTNQNECDKKWIERA